MRKYTHAVFCILFFFLYGIAEAHTMEYDFASMGKGAIAWEYLKLGFTHIVPLGLDHILFILAIFLIKPQLKAVFWQATVFTIAHSITLGLALNGIIKPLSSIVEPIIALSIVFVGLENLITNDIKWWRYLLIFLFGLIHGCGFAGALMETGLPEKEFLLGLISFNAGVEIGQFVIIIVAYLLFRKWINEPTEYRRLISTPLSICISAIAIYWTIERVLTL